MSMYKWEECLLFIYEIENEGEYAKETTTRPKSRQQPMATNRSSTQRKIPQPEMVLSWSINKNVY